MARLDMTARNAAQETDVALGLYAEGTARSSSAGAVRDHLTTRERVALVVKRRDYPTRWVLDGLIQSSFFLLEREWAGSVELAVEIQPRLIVAVADPARAVDLHMIAELARSSSAFLLLLAPARGGYAEALLAGADACLCDDDGPAVFAAQVAAVIRKEPASEYDDGVGEGVLRAGDLVVELRAYRAIYHDRPLALTPKEFAILGYLVAHAGALCRSTEIMSALTGEILPEPAASERLKTHISHLRRKLRAVVSNEDPILNVRGIGYRVDSR